MIGDELLELTRQIRRIGRRTLNVGPARYLPADRLSCDGPVTASLVEEVSDPAADVRERLGIHLPRMADQPFTGDRADRKSVVEGRSVERGGSRRLEKK